MDLARPDVDDGVNRVQEWPSQDDGDVDVRPHVKDDEIGRGIFILDFNQDVLSDSIQEPNGLVSRLQYHKGREQNTPLQIFINYLRHDVDA